MCGPPQLGTKSLSWGPTGTRRDSHSGQAEEKAGDHPGKTPTPEARLPQRPPERRPSARARGLQKSPETSVQGAEEERDGRCLKYLLCGRGCTRRGPHASTWLTACEPAPFPDAEKSYKSVTGGRHQVPGSLAQFSYLILTATYKTLS